MARVYEISQTVLHTITVRADSLDDAELFADGLADDGFTDQEWGDTTVKVLPKKITEADEDVTDEEE